MKRHLRRSIWHGALLFSVTLAVGSFVGCKKQQATETPTQVQDAPYVATDGSVSINLLPTQGSVGSQSWLASYADESGITKFSIELGPTTPSSNPSISSGKGSFIPVNGSDPVPLLEHLKKALQAKHMPAKIQQVDKLDFDYAVLGANQSRDANGGFSDNPKGNWMALQIFLEPDGKDESEVYLNINPVTHIAEFAMKDPDYGDLVLAQIAKIL